MKRIETERMSLDQVIDCQIVANALRESPCSIPEIQGRIPDMLAQERIMSALESLIGTGDVHRDETNYALTRKGLRYPSNMMDRKNIAKDIDATLRFIRTGSVSGQ